MYSKVIGTQCGNSKPFSDAHFLREINVSKFIEINFTFEYEWRQKNSEISTLCGNVSQKNTFRGREDVFSPFLTSLMDRNTLS